MSAGELIDNGSRTHEPSLRELTAQLDDLKELLIAKHEATKTIMDERDRLYDTRFRAADTAVSAALSAQEKQTTLVFQASEKAIVKAEEAQREYNIRSNEFRGQLDDQAKTLMPRPETLTLFKALEDKIYHDRTGLPIERNPVHIITLAENVLFFYAGHGFESAVPGDHLPVVINDKGGIGKELNDLQELKLGRADLLIRLFPLSDVSFNAAQSGDLPPEIPDRHFNNMRCP